MTEQRLGLGNRSWYSKEYLDGDMRVEKQNDVWCLGALIYLTLTGKHPYSGAGNPIEENIRINKPCDFDMLRRQLTFELSTNNPTTKDGFDKYSLFEAISMLRLIFQEEFKRATITELLKHPFMWTLTQKSAFIRKLEDASKNDKTLVTKINQLYLWNPSLHEHWLHFLDPKLIDYINANWKYASNSTSLLLAMRNCSLLANPGSSVVGAPVEILPNNSLKKDVLFMLGSEGIEVFVKTFPKIIIQLWKAARSHLKELEAQVNSIQNVLHQERPLL